MGGGRGSVQVSYRNASSFVIVNLLTGTSSGGGGNDTLARIESIDGSNYNDILKGDDNGNALVGWNGTLEGGKGNDYIFGEPGNDILNGGIGQIP